jgi:hypothetical protein
MQLSLISRCSAIQHVFSKKKSPETHPGDFLGALNSLFYYLIWEVRLLPNRNCFQFNNSKEI